jgi:hypothetical protein
MYEICVAKFSINLKYFWDFLDFGQIRGDYKRLLHFDRMVVLLKYGLGKAGA